MVRRIVKAKLSWVWILACFVAAMLIPVFVENAFYIQVLTTAAIMAISVMGLDLLMGYTGYVSFGHAGMMGIGGYTSALLVVKLGWSIWLAMPTAVIFTGLIAYIVSIPVFRLSGMYFAIGTLAFGQIVNLIIYNWRKVTGGAFGLLGIPSPFQSLKGYYYFVFICLFIVGILLARLVSSPVGKAMISIKENEKLAESTGVATLKLKRFVFTVSGMIAAFSGALLVHLLGFASASSFGVSSSLEQLVITVVGGLGTLIGPGIGAFILSILGQYLAPFKELRLMIYGLVLILIIMFLPGGIVGTIQRKIASFIQKNKRGESNVTVKSTQLK